MRTRPRLTSDGLAPVEENGVCCFANQEKVWVDGPDGAWEIYTVLEDSDAFGRRLRTSTTRVTRCAAPRFPKRRPAAAELYRSLPPEAWPPVAPFMQHV